LALVVLSVVKQRLDAVRAERLDRAASAVAGLLDAG
jgi:hypothetical protein